MALIPAAWGRVTFGNNRAVRATSGIAHERLRSAIARIHAPADDAGCRPAAHELALAVDPAVDRPGSGRSARGAGGLWRAGDVEAVAQLAGGRSGRGIFPAVARGAGAESAGCGG